MSVDLDIVSHDFSDSACVREVSDSALEGKAKSHNETGFDHCSLLLSLLLLSQSSSRGGDSARRRLWTGEGETPSYIQVALITP